MKLSKFGQKFTQASAIHQLMQDLGEANNSNNPDLCMLGGGNPAQIPAAHALFAAEMETLISNNYFLNMVGDYDGPQGESKFIQALTVYLNDKFNWSITPENVSITNGSQNSFFYLFNALAGDMPDGTKKKILFPIAPEYVGYADSGLSKNMFSSQRPSIELLENKQFKYHIDFNKLTITDEIAAICLSRPTNPTGNVIDNEELEKLDCLARKHDIPLIIDNAYGQPFPNILYTQAYTHWNENTVLCISLSKLGLPGARTGIVIANKQITQMISSLSGIITLAPNSIGAALMTRLIKENEIDDFLDQTVKPFYQEKLDMAIKLFDQIFDQLPVLMHKPEGAFFLWLWCQDLPISSYELYLRLKKRMVLVIPGEEFFIDIDPQWSHTHECLRINYAQPKEKLQRGLEIIADELTKLYNK